MLKRWLTAHSIGPARKAAQAGEFKRCNATGLRTALRWCDFNAEFPLLAGLRPSESDPKQKSTTDRSQRGAYTDPHQNP